MTLPKVAVLAMGGTIVSSGSTPAQMTGYSLQGVKLEDILAEVPQINDVARLQVQTVRNLASCSIMLEDWLALARAVEKAAQSDDVVGVVVTHGTDTLEETAYFLNLTVKSKKPVVLVGSMRPATAISADGPMNLLNAVKLAADPNAQDRGVLIALNDQINAAREGTKTNTTNVDTFQAPTLGLLGVVAGGKNYFMRDTTMKHTHETEFDVSKLDKLPRVDIVYSHASDDSVLVDAAVAAGAKGIISAGSGNGSIHQDAEVGLANAVKKGVVVVRSSRTGSGIVTPAGADSNYGKAGFLDGYSLNPQKARLLLQLALTKTNDPKKIQEMFMKY